MKPTLPDPTQDRRRRLNERLRQPFIEGAEEEWAHADRVADYPRDV